ncbi:kelch-like protein 3 [Acyrthosiphon pisum]|uniref:BTB domain-containing protein n=1 Tax=Acyrthosiphon pisum TaxID=7029 RepID=A0A8R1VZT1_ACYPI|nr:kelch-like protein 3 [Acyrthosiphon pisum]|eukprot:XP_001945780.1 PREDICTED: kelch-like protein 3 [Acyrthosiphon pisum]
MATAADENTDLSQYKHRRHELSYSKLDEFRKGDTVWDVTLKSPDGIEIHAHKCVLASQSEYFESMFIRGFKEATQDVIQINDISSDVLKKVIDFMYTGELVTIEEDNVEEMLNAADMLQMEDIRNECVKYYMCMVHDINCLEFKETADLRAMTTLSEICLNYALQRFLHIAEHKSFLKADVTHIIQLIKSDDLHVTKEEPVYEAIIKWVKYDAEKRKHLLPDLLANVRLVFTSKDFLVEEVISHPLISSNKECLNIVNKVIVHFNYKYGDSLSKIIKNVKPRKHTTRLTMDEMRRLRHYNCSDSPGRPERGPIDLSDYFKDFDLNHHFPQIEWNQYMNEDNFHTRFSEPWRGINEGTTDDDEESVD